jgi:hypothetical protein
LLAALWLAASAVVVATMSSAHGTPAGSGAVTTTLNRATVDNKINIEYDQIRLHTIQPLDVLQLSSTAPAGWTAGWHQHTGPVIVSVVAGSLTFYQGSCDGVTVTAGHAFVEVPGVPIFARNEGGSEARWLTTQLIPVGAASRVDEPAQCGLP